MSTRQPIKSNKSKQKKAYTVSQMTRGRFTAPRSSLTAQSIRVGGTPSGRIGELKFVDTSFTGAAAVGASTFSAAQLLNGLANGTSASTRVGRQVNMKSLLIRYTITLNPTTVAGGAVRMLVVYDKQANAAAPVITDVLLADGFLAPNNISNRDRFVTLCDVITPPIGTAGDYASSDVVYKKINLETMFNEGVSGTIADITSGSIYLFFAQSGQMTTAAPSLSYRSRIRYTDV